MCKSFSLKNKWNKNLGYQLCLDYANFQAKFYPNMIINFMLIKKECNYQLFMGQTTLFIVCRVSSQNIFIQDVKALELCEKYCVC